MRSERVTSSGGVIYKDANGSFNVALILRGRLWCLPKGLIEQGETAEEAARREVHEETGLEGKIVGKIGKINYDFIKEKHVFKTVHFYLLKYTGGSVKNHDFEVDTAKWFSLSEAMNKLTYVNERKILRRAAKMMKSKTTPNFLNS